MVERADLINYQPLFGKWACASLSERNKIRLELCNKNFHLPMKPFTGSLADAFVLELLFRLVCGLEAMVCLLVMDDTCPVRVWGLPDATPLLAVVAAEVWRLNVVETAGLELVVLAWDDKEVCDDDLFIFGGGCIVSKSFIRIKVFRLSYEEDSSNCF